jgi:hypothetical protein
MKRALLTVFDIARGLVLGTLLYQALIILADVDPSALVFRYAGY